MDTALGGARTSHSSQGATADRVLVHVDTEQAHDQLVNSRWRMSRSRAGAMMRSFQPEDGMHHVMTAAAIPSKMRCSD
jgi:hypothetical protein